MYIFPSSYVLFNTFAINVLCSAVKCIVVPHFCCLACSRSLLEKKLADADVSEEDQNNLLKYLEKKETEFMRLRRHKMGADDFELLTMIGKGAFGEVIVFVAFKGPWVVPSLNWESCVSDWLICCTGKNL